MRVVALLCALVGCDGVFGLNTIPDPSGDATGSDSGSSAYSYVQFYAAHGEYGQQMVLVPFTVPPQPNALIVVAIGTYWNDPSLVTDTAGNAYMQVGSTPRSDGGSEVSIFYGRYTKTAPTFAITVNSIESTAHVGADEVTVIAHEYAGPFQTQPLDLDQHMQGTGIGSTGQVDSDCGMASPNAPEVMVAALTRDFNGDVTATPDWRLRKSIDLDHTMYAVLATEDRIAGPELANPVWSSVHDADGTTWACLWATFR